MLAAHLGHQLIDLVLALVVIGAIDRLVGGRGSARRTFRRSLPLAALALLLLALFFATLGNEWIGGFAWERFGARVAVRFLGIGAAYWGGLVVLPLLGAARAWRCGGARRAAALLLPLATGALAVEMSFVEPNHLVVERREIVLDDWPIGAPPLTIAVVADVQSPRFGAREQRLLERLRELAPRLVVVPGDLVSQSFDDAAAIECGRRVLAGATAPLGTFVVNGDVDPLVAGGIREVVRTTSARLLSNESVVLDAGFPLELAGFDPEEPDAFARALAAPPRARVRIALVHQPRHVAELAPAGFELVIAGHTHGGQIVLPVIGPLVTLSPLPDDVDAGGLHSIDGGLVYVSRGVGCEAGFAPPMRLFCPPELSLLTLRGPVDPRGRTADDAAPAPHGDDLRR